jgi:tRNA(Ile)-lysidine synthase
VLIDQLDNPPSELAAHFDQTELDSGGDLVLRTRRPGDTIQPLGMAGRKTLQDLYVDAKIPRSLRNYIPVLARVSTNDVLWVPGPRGRRSSAAAIGPATKQVLQLTFTRDLDM